MEQTAARAETSEDKVERASAAREESIDRAHDVRQQKIAAANQPDESATQKLNDVSKERAQYQSEAATRVQKLGVGIDEAATKIKVLGNRAPTKLSTELRATNTEYDMLKQDVATLERTPTTDWESTTSKIDSRISALNRRLEDLKDAIGDV